MKQKQRILVIPSWYPPDGGYFFKEHSEALQQAGWTCDVLVSRTVGLRKLYAAGPRALKGLQIGEENGLRVIRGSYLKVPGSEAFNIRGWARKTLRLYRKYERRYGRPDLILCHSVTWAGYAAALIRESYGIPFVIVEHRSFFTWRTPEARAMVKPCYLRPFRVAYEACSRIVPVSESLLPGLCTLLPGIEEKCDVIPNMIREDMFLPPPLPRTYTPFVFLWAGRLEAVKGLEVLIEAAGILKGQGLTGFSIRLAGKGSLREPLETLVKEKNLGDCIQFLGRLSRDNMQEEMQAAGAFVLPTLYEAFGAVLIEAMATGLPVIATRSGGPEHIVTPDCGTLVDVGDAEQLAGAMKEMMDDPARFDAAAIRQGTLDLYGQRAVMARFTALFADIAGE